MQREVPRKMSLGIFNGHLNALHGGEQRQVLLETCVPLATAAFSQ